MIANEDGRLPANSEIQRAGNYMSNALELLRAEPNEDLAVSYLAMALEALGNRWDLR